MSKFLAYSSPLFDTGGTPTLFKAQLKQQITDAGWQVIEDLPLEMTVKPPAYELVGGEKGSDVLRIMFEADAIRFYPTMINQVGSKKAFTIFAEPYQSYYGDAYVQFGVSESNRVPITLPNLGGYDGNVVVGKTQAVYDALIASTLPEAQKYDYELIYNPNRSSSVISDFHWYIKASAKAFGNDAVLDITAHPYIRAPRFIARGAEPGSIVKYTQTTQANNEFSVIGMPTPYATGFVYYLSISSRTIMLCVKTTVALEGPMYATFTNHAAAVAQTPYGCTPCELFVGKMSYNTPHYYVAEGNTTFFHSTNFDMLRPAHVWGVKKGTYLTSSNTSYYEYEMKSMFNDRASEVVEKIEDLSGSYGQASGTLTLYYALGAMAFTLDLYNNRFKKGKMPFDFTPLMIIGGVSGLSSNVYEQHTMTPSGSIEDFYAAARPMNNESLHLVADSQIQTYLTVNVAAGDTSFTVDSTALFPDSGTLKIGLETVTYTGKTATAFTGVTRSRESSIAAAYNANEVISIQYWIVVINKVGIRAGYNKPT